MKKFVALVGGAVLVPALMFQGGAVAQGHHSGSGHHAVAKKSAKKGKAKKKDQLPAVKPGSLFNNPGQPNIRNKIINALDNAPRHAQIRVMTWNFNFPAVTDALIRAHRRGATVRLIMARTLVDHEYHRLQKALKWHNSGRKTVYRSSVRTCSHSCRGTGGSEHSKWITISQSGRSKNVVMEGSFNITLSAMRIQWNDWYTVVGDQKVYDAYQKEFDQARKDKRAKPFSVQSRFRNVWFAPLVGQPDVVMSMLNKVQCHNVGKGAGIRGRTAVRVASAVITGKRGEKIARKLKQLVRQGCNVRVVYTLSTHTVLGILKGVPVHHMAWDTNGDGVFDRYLHMKAMSISGHYGNDRRAHIVFNSSANWSEMGIISDEQGMIVSNSGLERAYTKRINYLFGRAPKVNRLNRAAMRRNGVTDPYVKIRKELVG